ncbi:MAG: DUF1289 domain-containing protein [Rhizobiales bacterium]|nr:DUF1289 domain-containing protein [Hyphomicrobiales bacterium]
MESPCNQVCSLDYETGFCCGCGRDMAEITGWAKFSAVERKQIMDLLPRRMIEIERATS